MIVTSFQVNKLITMKLEKGKTIIYVNDKAFRQCMRLIVKIPLTKINSFEDIQSIDEVVNIQEDNNEETIYDLPPETEFWAHCSNIHAWVENNYDTRLLHSNLAFPLLKELTNTDDPLAKQVFKEEIVKRLGSGYPTVVEYLIENYYDNYLTREELIFGALISEEARVIYELERIIKENFYVTHKFYDDLDLCFIPNKKHVTGLAISFFKLNSFPRNITEFIYLKELRVGGNCFTSVPKSIGKLKKLQALYLFDNKIAKLPVSIGGLKSLKILNLSNNLLRVLPESITRLGSLEDLDLSENKFLELPLSLLKLKNLKRIKLRRIPQSSHNRDIIIKLVASGIKISQ